MDPKIDIDILMQYGIDQEIIKCLRQTDIDYLREIQFTAVKKGLFASKSFLISSPSGSGKTLIAELAALYNILKFQKKTLYLVPLRALANEKYLYFKGIYKNISLSTLYCVGDQDISQEILERSDLLIMTFEKFDSFLRINRVAKWIKQISTVIIDEVHIIADMKRGVRLENLIIQIFRYLIKPQLIALSATIGNPQKLADWLYYLEEKYCNNGFEFLMEEKRPIELQYSFIITQLKNQEIERISKQVVKEDGQILVFSNSRRDCEFMASEIKKEFSPQPINLEDMIEYYAIKYDFDPSAISFKLRDLIPHSVCFHHAGLNNAEKILVESLYRKKIIRILMTTSTLSAGINTPARAIIIKDYQHYIFTNSEENGEFVSESKRKKIPINRNLFHQICGRSGRPGYDEFGNVYILIKDIAERVWIEEYYFKTSSKGRFFPLYDDLVSQLSSNDELLSEIVLLQIAQNENCTMNDIISFLMESFHYFLIKEQKLLLNLSLGIFPINLTEILYQFTDRGLFQLIENLNICVEILHFDRDSELEIKLNYSPKKKENFVDIFDSNTDLHHFHDFLNNLTEGGEIKRNLKIKSKKGIICDCPNGAAYVNFFPFSLEAVNLSKNKFCIDKLLILYSFAWYSLHDKGLSVNEMKFNLGKYSELFEQEKDLVVNLVLKWIWPRSIIHLLMEEKFIRKNSAHLFEVYVPEMLCDLTLRNYLSPRIAFFIVNSLNTILQDANLTISTFIPLINNCLLMINPRPFLNLESVLDLWVNEFSIKDILGYIQQNNDNELVYEGDIISTIDYIERFFKFIYDCISKRTDPLQTSHFKEIYYRIKYGIKLDLVSWVERYKNIDIHYLRQIVDAGFLQPDSIKTISPSELSNKTNLSIDFCSSLYIN